MNKDSSYYRKQILGETNFDKKVKELKDKYSKVSGIDPASKEYDKITDFLDQLEQDKLKKLSDAGINFISRLAQNRIKESKDSKGYKEELLGGLTEQSLNYTSLDYDIWVQTKSGKKQKITSKKDGLPQLSKDFQSLLNTEGYTNASPRSKLGYGEYVDGDLKLNTSFIKPNKNLKDKKYLMYVRDVNESTAKDIASAFGVHKSDIKGL